MKRLMWSNLLLGVWLMCSPLILGFLKQAVVTLAAWNNVIIGAIILSLAAYQDWRDSTS